MSNNRELSEFADYLIVDDTTKNVGIGTTLKISAGGIFVGNTEIVRPDGTWGGPDTGLIGAQGAQGFQGAVGAQGAQGAVGAQGAQGAQGYQGAAGSATITNNADNRVITGGTGTNLNGEANLTFDGTNLGVNGAAAQTPIDVISNSSGNGITVRGRSADGLGNIRFTSNNYGTLYGGLNHNATDLNIFNELSGTLKLGTSGQDRFVIGSSGQFGIGGATYGTSGQVLTSQGSGSAPQWADGVSQTQGTWTPTLNTRAGDFTSRTITFQTSRYTRIGDLVHVEGYFTVSPAMQPQGGELISFSLPSGLSSANVTSSALSVCTGAGQRTTGWGFTYLGNLTLTSFYTASGGSSVTSYEFSAVYETSGT